MFDQLNDERMQRLSQKENYIYDRKSTIKNRKIASPVQLDTINFSAEFGFKI
jgi:hypothetical protein